MVICRSKDCNKDSCPPALMTRILANRGKDKKMTVKEIVIEKLRELCADGLCYDDECGCGLGNFMPVREV